MPQSSPKVYSYTAENTSEIISYTSAAQNYQFPKRDQGLIIDCVENLNLTDYTSAVAKLVGNKNILYSTRISNNRVCLYLAIKELVKELTDNQFIKIGGNKVNIRPLINKQQRVIFSNVAPPIPHFVLENSNDSTKLPDILKVNYEDVTYYIYPSTSIR